MSFRIGQKVVCIDADRTHDRGIAELVQGAIYTVRAFAMDGDLPCIHLAEIRDRPVFTGDEITFRFDAPFRRSRFRPLIERKPDISIFTEILHNTKSPITEKVQ